MKTNQIILPLAALWLVGCGGPTAGARPHDMSTEQHLQAASREESAAEAHAAQAAAVPDQDQVRCRDMSRGTVCWTTAIRPSQQHLREAEEHRRHAAEHRAAAQALQDAEATACAGIEPDDRDISPFYHREDIARVEPIRESTAVGRSATAPSLKGATVVFRAVPGMTAEWLLRVVNCHLARNASMGHEMPGMASCPLALKGVTVLVTSTGDGFAVAVRSDDPAVAADVLRRAQGLVQR